MATNEGIYTGYSRQTPLSAINLLLIGAGIGIYFFIGQFLRMPTEFLLAPPVALGAVVVASRRASILLSIVMVMVIVIQLRSSSDRTDTSLFAVVAGAILSGAFFFIIMKKTLDPDTALDSNEHKFFLMYFLWIGILGIIGIAFSGVRPEFWFREVLVISPLMILPFMFLYIDLEDRRDKWIVYGGILLVALISMTASVVNIRSSFLVSTYLFELSYKSATIINAPFMILIFFNLYVLEQQKRKQRYYLIGMVLGIVALLLTHNRTMWNLTPATLLITTVLLPTGQRKKAALLLVRLAVAGIAAIALLYVLFPFAKILVEFFLGYFLTTSNLKSDPSLNARYIEWRYVFEAITGSPIFGYGIGSTYHTYNWFAGYFYDSGYTHNGYLGIIQRGGIVGLILLMTGYLGFIRKGINLLRLDNLRPTELAFLRAGVSVLSLLLIGTNMLNIFAHRDILLHVGLIWGYILYIYRLRVLRQPGGHG